MDNDDEDDSVLLKRQYEQATAEQKEAIDNAMICLCGWSLKTAIERTTP